MKLKYKILNLILLLQPILIQSMEEEPKEPELRNEFYRLRDFMELDSFEPFLVTGIILPLIQKLKKEKVSFNNETGNKILENAIILSKRYSQKYGLDNIVILLIEAGAGKNGKSINEAVKSQNKEFVELLLKNGASIYSVNENGKNALEIAELWLKLPENISRKEDREKAKAIYDLIKEYDFMPELVKAIETKDISTVKKYANELIKYNLKYKDVMGNTLLHYAVMAKDPYIFKIILSLWPAAIDEKNNLGKSPMELIVGTWQDGLKYVKEAAKEAKK